MRLSVQKLLAVWVLTFSFAFTAYNQDDLSLSVSTTSGTVDVGDTGIQFTVTVSNEGATEINDVEVTMSVPAGLTLTGTSVGGSYTPGSGIWDIGTISAGTASVTMIMTFDVTGEGVHTLSGNITNMDVIDGDSDPTDNSVLEDDYGASCVTAPYEYCAGETIDITATAPAGHNSYQWKLNGADIPGETNQTYNIVAPGNYSYTVNVGATGSCAGGSCCDIIVIENTLPTASISNSPNVTVIDCTNTSIDLTASGGGTYAWSDGTNNLGTNATITITAAGTYTVTVTSAEGCTDTEAVTITEDTTPPTASISNSPNVTVIDCMNTSIDLTASGGGTYAWSDGTNNLGTNATITVTSAGTYTVTVTAANGCTDTEAVTITEDTTPPTASISNSPNVTVIDCTNTSIDLTASGGGTYAWSDGTNNLGTNATITVTSAGTYTVTVTAANGCTDTEAVTITEDTTPPTASISNSPNVTVIDCTNTSIDLTASGGGTYAWSDGTNNLGTNATITVTSAGTYTVTVTTANGCTDTEAVTITEDTTPPTASISNSPNVTVIDCTNTSIDLTASGGGTYAWSDGTNNLGTNATITVTSAGTYTVTVTTANGCTDTEAVTITEDTTPPTASISNSPNVTVIDCTNTSIDLTASGGGTYAWSDGTNNLGTNATITVTAAGTYTVTVTAANGCTDTEAVTITEDTTPPSAAITNNDATTEITCLQTSISLTATGGVGYSWAATGGGTIAGATNVATISATSAGTFTVTVTGINGCTATAQEVLTGSCTVDYADLPDGTAGNGPGDYNTTLANNGPSHGIIAGLTLGTNIDAESDGQPSANGDGDDTDVGGDDDDGVTIGSSFDVVPGGTIRLPYDGTNSTGNDANLVAWVDWDNDGVFEAGEQVTPIVIPGTGAFNGYLTIPVPEGAATGTNIGVLVRLSNSPIASPDGYLSSGEVESYMLTVNCPTQICLPATSVKN